MPESFPLAIKPGWSCWTGCVPHPSRFVPPSLASQDFWSRAWAGRALSTPKNKNGRVEALRVLRLMRAGAVRSRTKALQLLRSHAVSAPDEVRDEVRFPDPDAPAADRRGLAARL